MMKRTLIWIVMAVAVMDLVTGLNLVRQNLDTSLYCKDSFCARTYLASVPGLAYKQSVECFTGAQGSNKKISCQSNRECKFYNTCLEQWMSFLYLKWIFIKNKKTNRFLSNQINSLEWDNFWAKIISGSIILKFWFHLTLKLYKTPSADRNLFKDFNNET